MRRLKLAVALAAVLCTFSVPLTGYAAEKINSVNVKLELEDFDEWGYPILSATVRRGHYSVNDVITASEFEGTESRYEGETDIYVIDLSADDGHYFNVARAESINISGLGADFIKAARQNNGSSLYVTVRLTGVGTYVGEIGEARWEKDGYGAWDGAYGAGSYAVCLYDEKNRAKRAETGGCSYDFRPFMQKAGNYSYKVRPLSSTREGGDWVEAGGFTVSEEMAAANKALFEVKKDVSYQGGIKEPSHEVVVYENTGWQVSDDGRYWYRYEDASYPQESWMQEESDWYYFGDDGYRKSGEYAMIGNYDYYFCPDGKLLTGTTSPDGRQAGEDGKLPAKKQ